MKSIDHHYAKVAYQCVMQQSEATASEAESYGRLCHKFPSMVMLNGLRLTATYFYSNHKEDPAYLRYLEDMGQALNFAEWNNIPESNTEYRHLSRNALRASIWFKRYAEAILHVNAEQTSLYKEGAQK